MDELISVIVPVYNVENYLKRCIDSIIQQSYKNIEIILVNDGSKDNSPEICDEYRQKDDRVIVVQKENGGLSDARNAGIEIAKGKYLTFIDSDDYIKEDYIDVLYKSIKNGGTDISIASHKVIYENGTVLEKSTGEISILSPKQVLKRILYDDGIDLSAWAKLYKRELFENIRYPKGRVFEDAATTYKLIDKSEAISICSKSVYCYIIRSSSITNKAFTQKKMDLITSTGEMCSYISKKYPDLKSAAERRLMYAYLSTLSQLANSSVKFPKQQKELITYIRKNGFKILFDKYVPKRDKIGIIAANIGFEFYKFVWDIYKKITGRK